MSRENADQGAQVAGILAGQMALLETVFQKAPVGLAVVDRDFHYLQINEALARINGASVEDHIGRTPQQVVPALWPAIEPHYRLALRGEVVRNIEISGEIVPHGVGHWLASFYPVQHDGAIIGIGIVVNDISELHQYREALRRRTELYAMISQMSRAAIAHTSATALFHDVCEIAIRAGHFRFAWIGVPDGNLVRPVASCGEDRGYLATLVVTRDPADPRSHGPTGRTLATGEVTVVNDFAADRDTAPWHALASAAGLASSAAFALSEQGRVSAVLALYSSDVDFFDADRLATVGEVTPIVSFALDAMANARERERADEQLRLQDRAIRAVQQGICIVDMQQPDSPMTFVSPGFERITGYAASEMLGRNCRLLQGTDTDPDTVQTLRAAIHNGAACTAEILNYRKDGTPFWNELTIGPVVDDRGTLTHFVGVQADVTERRRLEQLVRQSQKMEAVGQLAAGVAHDFNNLLTVVDVCSDMLVSALDPTDPSHELAVEIQRAGERAGTLTRQLLAFSRTQVIAPRLLDLNDIVADSEKLLRRLIGEHILLTTSLHDSLWSVFADAGQIEQVLINLAVNARDAMPSGGNLIVATGELTVTAPSDGVCPGEYVTLDVTDSGTGIDAATLARMFDPFFTTKTAGKGTGLGLATVRSIVDTAHGHVVVKTEAGRGSTFRVLLPRAAESHETTTTRATDDMPSGSETILLAEDDDAVRSLGRRILERCGYTVLQASDGHDALRLAREFPGVIDLLVSDVVMPHLGGRQLAEAVRAVRPACKVLFVSGYTDDEVLLHGVVHSEVTMLQKPYSLASLAQLVRQVLDD